jgi:hypothetical protein
LLGETGPDDIASQVLKASIVAGPYSGIAIDIKAAVVPGQHVFNDGSVYFTLDLEHLEHLEHFISKQRLQIFGHRTRASGECAAAGKTAISGDQVQLGIILQDIAEGVNGDGGPGHGQRRSPTPMIKHISIFFPSLRCRKMQLLINIVMTPTS